MKITDPEIIKTGEKDLIDAVKDDLDLDAVKQVLEKKLAATVLSAKGGEIIVHNNEIAFRLDFDLNLSGSLMFDREGNYISGPDEPAGSLSDDPAGSPVDDPIETIVVDMPEEPDELDLDKIDIQETLEAVRPDAPADGGEENIQGENQEEFEDATSEFNGDESDQVESGIIDDIDMEEELDISLLDDDLDEDLNDDLDDDLDVNLAFDEENKDEPIEMGPSSDETELLENEPGLESELADGDALSDDEDIDDILKESRKFWEQKKDS